MKNNYIKFILFLGVLFVIDFSIGSISNLIIDRQTSGTIGLINKAILDRSNILILGSSRAQNHYNSRIISEKTKHTVFNAGIGGQGNFAAYAILKERLQKNNPHIVVLDLAPNIILDLKQFEKLTTFYPLTNKYKSFDSIVTLNPNHKSFLMYSKAYKYNSTAFDFFYNFISPNNFNDGFTAIDGKISKIQIDDELKNENSIISKKELEMIYLQLSYVNKMKLLCLKKNIEFVSIISPCFLESLKNKKTRELIKNYLDKHNIILHDFSVDKSFTYKQNLFKDLLHLNKKGSDVYSDKVASVIQMK